MSIWYRVPGWLVAPCFRGDATVRVLQQVQCGINFALLVGICLLQARARWRSQLRPASW